MDNINKTIDETTNIENEPVLSCLKQIRSQLRNQAPLIHCITHPIVINDCANAVLPLVVVLLWLNIQQKWLTLLPALQPLQSVLEILQMQELSPCSWLEKPLKE